MSLTTDEQFQAFKDELSETAKQQVHDLFPRKTLEMEKMLRTISSEDFSSTQSVDDVRGAEKANAGEPVPVVPFCPPCNAKIIKITEMLKPELVFVIEQLNSLKMWISLNIPKTRDGNNFGAAIQSETHSELIRIEGDVAALYESIPWYFVNRAKLISRCMKYPQVEDHRKTVQQLDGKQREALHMMCAEVRNIYCCLHDMILKNMEKLKRPSPAGGNMMMY